MRDDRQPPRQLQILDQEEPPMSTTAIARPNEEKLEAGLVALRERVNSIVVCDADSYRAICEAKNEGQIYLKGVGFEFDPGIAKVKDALDHLKDQKARWVDQAKPLVELAGKKAEDYRTEEKRKADAEARRLQEEARVAQERKAAEERRAEEARIAEENKRRQKEIADAKATGELKAREAAKLQKQADADAEAARKLAEQEAAKTAAAVPVVKVEASIPKVAGSKNQTYFKFEIIAPQEVKAAWLMPDAVAIGRKVRDDKDPAKSMTEIGGIKVWSEG